MSLLLRIIRLPAIIVWFIFCASITAFLYFHRGWNGTRKISSITRLWAAGIVKITNIKIKVSGTYEDIRGALLVSNHMSYVDVLIHAKLFAPRFTPKSAVRDWPFLGAYVQLSRPVWVDRVAKKSSKEILVQLRETLENGINLVLYPEGTSTDGKEGVRTFKSSLFELALTGTFSIIPVITVYRDKPGEPGVPWFGDMTLVPHLWKLLGRKSVEAEIHILEPFNYKGLDRKQIAYELHRKMNQKYLEIYGLTA